MTSSSLVHSYDDLISNLLVDSIDKLELEETLLRSLPTTIIQGWELPHNCDRNSDDFQCLFDLRSAGDKRTVACVLLDFFYSTDADDKLANDLNEGTIRGKIYSSFFDDAFAFIYESTGTQSEQNHVKRGIILEAYNDTISQLENIKNRIVDIPSLVDLRGTFQSTYRQNKNKIIIDPIMRRRLEDSSFEIFLQQVSTFASSRHHSGTTHLDSSSYNESMDAIQEVLGTIESLPKTKIRETIIDLINHIKEIIETDFTSDERTNPTQLKVSLVPRRYPLHNTDSTFNLRIMVQNSGSGIAIDSRITIEGNNSQIETPEESLVGDLNPRQSRLIEIPVTLKQPSESIDIHAILSWKSFFGTEDQQDISELRIPSQDPNINWLELERKDLPYPLTPIEERRNLRGRTTQLNEFVRYIQGANVQTCWVHGHKRVGKTSFVKALEESFKESNPEEDLTVIWLEAGLVTTGDAEKTISNIVNLLIDDINLQLAEISRLIPRPTDSEDFSAFGRYLRQLTRLNPNKKIVFVFDEFDQLPYALFERGGLGDAFFSVFKTISNFPTCGFVLVGGEKIRFIKDGQGAQLNTARTIILDHFDFDTELTAIQDIIRNPVPEFQYDDSAIQSIYQWTGGNPYFINALCSHLYEKAVANRDAYITDKEVNNIAREVATSPPLSPNFQHYWEDGLLDIGERQQQQIAIRKVTLFAIIDCWEANLDVTLDNILSKSNRYQNSNWDFNQGDIAHAISEFTQRNILVLTYQGETAIYETKIKLFGEWLKSNGKTEILSDSPDPEAIERVIKKDQEHRITETEIVNLADRWGPFKSSTVGPERIRAWLDQFDSPQSQRLMFKLATRLKLYTEGEIRDKLSTLHHEAKRGLPTKLGREFERDVAVSHIDNIGKSSASFVRLYKSVNRIPEPLVVPFHGQLWGALLRKTESIKTIVIIDDFVGTGKSLQKELTKLIEDPTFNFLKTSDIRILVGVICGFSSNIEILTKNLKTLNPENDIVILDELFDEDRAFSDKSTIWDDELEMDSALKIAADYGGELEKKNPLGFEDSQALVAFPSNCPNNTLPIFWKVQQRNNKEWQALFPRDV